MKNQTVFFLAVIAFFVLISCEKEKNGSEIIKENITEVKVELVNSPSEDVIREFEFSSDGTIYALGTYGLYNSENNGDTWQKIREINGGSLSNLFINQNDEIIINLHGDTLLKSADGGSSWDVSEINFTDAQTTLMAVDKQNRAYLSVSLSNTVYTSMDIMSDNWDSIAIDYEIIHLATTNKKLFVLAFSQDSVKLLSVNHEDNAFETIHSFKKNSFTQFALDESPTTNDIFFIVNTSLFKMNSNAKQLQQLNTPDSVDGYFTGFSDLRINSSNHLYMYREASYPADFYPSIVYRSTNEGDTWERIEPTGEYIFTLDLSPSNQLFISSYIYDNDDSNSIGRVFRSNRTD